MANPTFEEIILNKGARGLAEQPQSGQTANSINTCCMRSLEKTVRAGGQTLYQRASSLWGWAHRAVLADGVLPH